MKWFKWLAVLLWIWAGQIGSGQVWQFDLDAADAPANETQPGYTRMTVEEMTGDSTNGAFLCTGTLNGVTVTATSSGGFRDRGTGNYLTNEPLAALLRDFIFKDGVGGTIQLTITGLPAGDYDLRTFHFDNSNQGALSNNAYEIVVQDADSTSIYGGLVWSVTGENYRVRSDGTNVVTVTARENGVGHRVRFNGLRIVRHYAFDIDAADAPAEETQAGSLRWTTAAMTGNSTNGAFSVIASLDNVTVTATAGGGFRDRGTNSLTTQPAAPLLRDFLFTDGAGAAITVTIDGLEPGEYEIASYHWDNVGTAADNGFNLALQDADGTRTLTGLVWSASAVSSALRADGVSPVLLTVIEANARNRARLNGLMIGGGEALIWTPIPPAEPGDHVAGNMIQVNDNAGWCWYQDEKAIYDAEGGKLVTSTIANLMGYDGAAREALVEVSTFEPFTGRRTRAGMGVRQTRGDDHNIGALWIRPDGTYFHVTTGHNDSTRNSYFRISTLPHNGESWTPEQFFNWLAIGNPDTSGNVTYHNLFFLQEEGTGAGRLYNISRESQRSPNISYSDDHGQTWHYAGKLTLTRTASSYSNGYLKFAGNGVNRIDFITTEHHPRDYNTSIYHGYIQGGQSFNSLGVLVDTSIFDEIAPAPEDFTPVFLSSPEDGVNDHLEYHRAWTVDMARDPLGRLAALFTTRYGTNVASNRSGDADHRLFYGRFDGVQWRTVELGKMGGPLYYSEQDYTGLGAIHPRNPDLICISTPFDPRNGSALGRRELFKGVTRDAGATWVWTQLTFNSTVDNLRPAIPDTDPAQTIICWLRGDYVTQRDFDQALMTMIETPAEVAGPVTYIDATTVNTTYADGSPLNFTGPGENDGAGDGLWHQQTRFGNGGSAWTANETVSEDVPALKTSIGGLAGGTYDVFAFFWSRPGEDWRLKAGFSPDEMQVFRRRACQQAETNHFGSSVVVLQDDVALYRAYVGRARVTNGEPVEVVIDDFDGLAASVNQRSAFDGVGVSRVVTRVDIQQVVRVGADLKFTVVSPPGQSCQLQRAGQLPAMAEDWQNVGSPKLGTGAAMELEHLGALGAESGFYRVVAGP